MSVTIETIVIKKQIVTISYLAKEKLRNLAIRILFGLFSLVIPIAILFFTRESHGDTHIFGSSLINIILASTLLSYLYFAQRKMEAANERTMREFGWDGTHPVEMRTDNSSSLMLE